MVDCYTDILADLIRWHSFHDKDLEKKSDFSHRVSIDDQTLLFKYTAGKKLSISDFDFTYFKG